MTRNDPKFIKIQKIERLIFLKKNVEEVKVEVTNYLAERTQSLREKAEEVDLPFDIDDKLELLATGFDEQLQEIETALLSAA